MSATPEPASNTIGIPEHASTELGKNRPRRECLRRSPKKHPRSLENAQKLPSECFGTPKSRSRSAPEAPWNTLRAAFGQPEPLPGAAKARICKSVEREQLFHRPAESTWDRLSHPAPPVVELPLPPSSLHRSRLPALPGASPHAGPPGSADSTGLRPLPPTRKENHPVSNVERGPRRFYSLISRRMVEPGGIMSATPEPAFKTIGRPEHASTDPGKPALAENASADLRKNVRETSRTPKNGPRSAPGRPKIALGVPRELPGASSGPPSDSPRSSPEPPKRELANRYRGSTIFAAPRGSPGSPSKYFGTSAPIPVTTIKYLVSYYL